MKRRLNNLVRWIVSVMGPQRYAARVGELIGYAGCSTVPQDLAAQREALAALGVCEEGIYLDRGLTGPARARPGLRTRPWLPFILATPWSSPKLDRPVRTVPGPRQIGDSLAEFEAGLLRLGTKEGKAIAWARGSLKERRPKLSALQQAELRRMHGTGGYTIAELMEVFSVGRAAVYRVFGRDIGGSAATAGVDTA